jgi:hypothetical protein
LDGVAWSGGVRRAKVRKPGQWIQPGSHWTLSG